MVQFIQKLGKGEGGGWSSWTPPLRLARMKPQPQWILVFSIRVMYRNVLDKDKT